jgi:hypothetical protein
VRHTFWFGILIIATLLGACQMSSGIPGATPITANTELVKTPTLTPIPTTTNTPIIPTLEPAMTYWYDDTIPVSVQLDLCFPEGVSTAISKGLAGIHLSNGSGKVMAYRKMYALAGRFDLLQDDLSLDEVKDAWLGQGDWDLEMSQETYQAFEEKWGSTQAVLIVDDPETLVNQVWSMESLLAILPFDGLVPRLKVLQVGGVSPLDKNMNVEDYPMQVEYFWQGDANILSLVSLKCEPGTNRDINRMTDVLMTGVSALTRNTAARMAEKGVTYPAEEILEWLKSADITHISHEVSFYTDCPDPLPVRAGGRFCAQLEFLELFTYAGVDVVELTGNHLNDWGVEAIANSIKMYHEAGILTFGGGLDAETARQPLLIEHNGNKLAFLGCNSIGPESDWATEVQPGAAQCDLDWMAGEVQRLRDDGYLPIVTFQGFEVCDVAPHSTQRVAAKQMAEAGAVIVSGSQAHCPQAYSIQGDTFIHYGLGNLWFDQMDRVTRQELLDRYVFYDNQLISVEIKTAILEDFAQPRPMTTEERRVILEKVFDASKW